MDQSPKKKLTKKVTFKVIDFYGWRARSSAQDFFLNITIFFQLYPMKKLRSTTFFFFYDLKAFISNDFEVFRGLYIAECDISQVLLA